jgi:hypothetical protein
LAFDQLADPETQLRLRGRVRAAEKANGSAISRVTGREAARDLAKIF